MLTPEEFIEIKGRCPEPCGGGDQLERFIIKNDGDPFDGVYANCSKCKTTRFIRKAQITEILAGKKASRKFPAILRPDFS